MVSNVPVIGQEAPQRPDVSEPNIEESVPQQQVEESVEFSVHEGDEEEEADVP